MEEATRDRKYLKWVVKKLMKYRRLCESAGPEEKPERRRLVKERGRPSGLSVSFSEGS